MPRLTNPDYLHIHHRLRELWLRDAELFSWLSPAEQWSIHDFFAPSRDLSDERLLVRRRQVSSLMPSLPQRAGRAVARFWDSTAEVAVERVRSAKDLSGVARRSVLLPSDRRLSVRGLARPEPDVELLARVFVRVAREHSKRESDQSVDTGAGRSRP